MSFPIEPVVEIDEVNTSQTSVASEPSDVRVRVPFVQTAAGTEEIADASDVEAVSTAEFVFAFTLDVIPDVCVLVFAFTTAAIDEEAVTTSLCSASAPESNVVSDKRRVAYVQTSAAVRVPPPLVKVRVPLDQMSDTSVPNVVRERDALFQTPVGMVASNDVDAVKTVALVFELMVEIAVAT